jgi:hypothetical protein
MGQQIVTRVLVGNREGDIIEYQGREEIIPGDASIRKHVETFKWGSIIHEVTGVWAMDVVVMDPCCCPAQEVVFVVDGKD